MSVTCPANMSAGQSVSIQANGRTFTGGHTGRARPRRPRPAAWPRLVSNLVPQYAHIDAHIDARIETAQPWSRLASASLPRTCPAPCPSWSSLSLRPFKPRHRRSARPLLYDAPTVCGLRVDVTVIDVTNDNARTDRTALCALYGHLIDGGACGSGHPARRLARAEVSGAGGVK